MSRYVFGPHELPDVLRQQSQRHQTGYLTLEFRTAEQTEVANTWVLTFRQGKIIFSADQPLGCQVFLQRIARFIPRLKLAWSQRAIQVIQDRLVRDQSVPELIEGMTQLALLKKGEVADALKISLMTDFDRYLLRYAGTCQFQPDENLEKNVPFTGLDVEACLQQAAERRDKWTALEPAIPSMLTIPIVNWERVNRHKVADDHKQKLYQLTHENQSLEVIAAKMSRDRLEVAQLFANWIKRGIVSLQTPPELRRASQIRSKTILAVDDSVVMQEMLRQALSDYRIITTGKPADLISLLFQHHPNILLMDLTMPDIDGLELCRMVRNLDEFKTLPIIMITSRDGLFDRIKGKLSGATTYLTKPFDQVQLNYEVEKLLAQAAPKRTSPPITTSNPWTDPALNPSTGA